MPECVCKRICVIQFSGMGNRFRSQRQRALHVSQQRVADRQIIYCLDLEVLAESRNQGDVPFRNIHLQRLACMVTCRLNVTAIKQRNSMYAMSDHAGSVISCCVCAIQILLRQVEHLFLVASYIVKSPARVQSGKQCLVVAHRATEDERSRGSFIHFR